MNNSTISNVSQFILAAPLTERFTEQAAVLGTRALCLLGAQTQPHPQRALLGPSARAQGDQWGLRKWAASPSAFVFPPLSSPPRESVAREGKVRWNSGPRGLYF